MVDSSGLVARADDLHYNVIGEASIIVDLPIPMTARLPAASRPKIRAIIPTKGRLAMMRPLSQPMICSPNSFNQPMVQLPNAINPFLLHGAMIPTHPLATASTYTRQVTASTDPKQRVRRCKNCGKINPECGGGFRGVNVCQPIERK